MGITEFTIPKVKPQTVTPFTHTFFLYFCATASTKAAQFSV